MTLQSVLSQARDAAFLAAIYLFFAGFQYRREYLERFGVPATASSTDTFVLPIYALTVLRDAWWIVAIGAVGTVLLIALLVRYPVRGRQRRTVRWARQKLLVPFIAVVAFPILALSAHTAAVQEERSYKTIAKTNVELLGIGFDVPNLEKDDVTGIQIKTAAQASRLHLLAVTDKVIYAVLHRPGDTLGPGDFLVIGFPREKVSHFDVEVPE